MMSQKRFSGFVFSVVLLCVAVINVGCGGGSSTSGEKVSASQVSVIGSPTGELAGVLLDAQTTDEVAGLGKGDVVILAGMAEVEDYSEDVKEAFRNGATVAVLGAVSVDAKVLQGILGTEADEMDFEGLGVLPLYSLTLERGEYAIFPEGTFDEGEVEGAEDKGHRIKPTKLTCYDI